MGQAPANDGRILALLALGLASLIAVNTLLGAQQVMSDWHAYYRAATALRTGGDLYAEGRLLVERNSYDFWLQTDGQYVYPPLLALLLVPLTLWLDIGKAGDLWLLLLALSTIAALWIVLRLLERPLSLPALAPLALVALASVPLNLSLRYGQADLPLLLLLLLSLLAATSRRDLLAGLALGLAVAIKPTFALYGLFFLRKRRWRTLLAAAASGLLLALIPLLLLGPTALTDWLTIARFFGGEYLTYPSNQSVRGWLLRAFVGGPRHLPLLESRWLADGLWWLIVGAALTLWWRSVDAHLNQRRRATAELGLTVVLVLLIAPLSEDIHYAAMLVPLAVLADGASQSHRDWRWRGLALLAMLYFLQPWLDFAYNRGGSGLRGLLASGAYLYGLGLTGLALLASLRPATSQATAADRPAAASLNSKEAE